MQKDLTFEARRHDLLISHRHTHTHMRAGTRTHTAKKTRMHAKVNMLMYFVVPIDDRRDLNVIRQMSLNC